MAGTRIPAVKAALIGKAGALREVPGLNKVLVAYSYPADPGRECVYGDNSATGPVSLAAMKPAGGRLRREEDTTFGLVVMVTEPGHDNTEVVEARAAEIGTAIEEYIAANPTCGDLADVKVVDVVSIELDSGVDDESATAVLTYQIHVKSSLQ